MAHYAFLDENNIVVQVIVGRNEDEVVDGITSWEQHYGDIKGMVCKRTSYNTLAGEHSLGGVPYRGNYAGIGYEYREDLDAFIPPKPFPSWIFNSSIYSWEAPVPRPEDGKIYAWNESNQSWDEVPTS